MRNKLLISIASAALLAAPAALAQGSAGTTSEVASKSADQQILEELHAANQQEIDMGKLGKSHGASKAVKDFAEMMVKDHTAADKQVSDFAKAHKISLKPTTAEKDMDKAEHKEMKDTLDKLKKLKGAEFDKEFMAQMVTDHDKVIAKVTSAQGKVDSATGELLSKLLTTLQSHKDMASKVQGQVASK